MLIDSHLHYYEYYSARVFLEALSSNLEGLSGEPCVNAGVVLDRSGYRGFDLLAERSELLSDADVVVDGDVIRYRSAAGSVDVYRGVQIACSDGFEILGLFCSIVVDQGASAANAVGSIKAAGGIPVVAWAPGKWLFSRRSRVCQLLREEGPVNVCVGDSALRPDVWGEPDLMLDFRCRGGKILCGSDPLPYSGQERVAGTYASVLNTCGAETVVDSIRRIMHAGDSFGVAGRRARVGEFVVRQIRLRLPV